MKKFFGDSCLPQCGDDEKGFSMLVASTADCPTDISKGNRKEFKEVAVRPKDFCEAEVRHDGFKYRKVAFSRLSRLVAHSSIFRMFMKEKFDTYVL